MIKYIGSKRLLVARIVEIVKLLQPEEGRVADLFSGTSRVGHALKREGFSVTSNDHNAYAATLARCYVQADAEDWLVPATQLVAEFNALRGEPAYFTDTFCVKSRFFQPKNGERVDAIREEIGRKGLPPELEAIMLVSLMEAADRVDSTTGVQMAYLKTWAPRAHNDIALRVPDLLPRAAAGKGQALQFDVIDALRAANDDGVDVFYYDPPYNQHKYLGNYHVWESLVLWDKPEVYGVACKRVDCKERGSDFNSARKAEDALRSLVRATSGDTILSFNNEGYIDRMTAIDILHERYDTVVALDFVNPRYVGAKIGIHNLKGEKVGNVSHTENTETIFVGTHNAGAIEEMERIGGVVYEIAV